MERNEGEEEMKKLITWVLTLTLFVSGLTVLSGCSAKENSEQNQEQQNTEGEAQIETAGKKNVYIITPYLSSVTTKEMVNYMQSSIEEINGKVTVIDTEGETATLASRVEDAVTAKADAIVIVSVDPSYCEEQIKEASDAGIPVFGCDAGYLDTMQMNATSDNYAIGKLITEYLFEKINHAGNIIVLTDRTHPGVGKRTAALDDVLKENPDIKVIAEEHVVVPGPIESGKSSMESLILANPDPDSITAVWCGWDEPGIGAAQALSEAEREGIVITGVDANEQAVAMIEAGDPSFIATVKQDFPAMAKMVVDEMTKVFNGEAAEKGEYYAEATIID